MFDLTKHAKNGRRILNENIRRDYVRLLELLAEGSEVDGAELERMAGKYRFYFDDEGHVKEAD